MYSSKSQHTSWARSCIFDDEEENSGNRTTLDFDRDTSDLNQEVYLCMAWHGGFLGLSYYHLDSLHIHFMLDIQENDNFAIVRQVVHQIHPSVIALNTIQDSRLLAFLRSIISEISVTQSGSSNDVCRLEFLPNVDFNYEVSKRRILALCLPSLPKHLSQDERRLYFSSLLPFNASNMISSVGGLLKYLEKTRVGIELEADAAHVPVLGFKAFIPEHHIQMDGLTYCALKIFETEIHPSTYKAGNSGGKEGLSLYDVSQELEVECYGNAKATATTYFVGCFILQLRLPLLASEWFLRPLKSAAPVKQRHEAVAFFISAHNLEVVKCLSGCLKHIKYIPKILLRMSKAQATVADWNALYKTLYHAVYIGDIAKAQPDNIEIFRKISNAFTEDLHRCVNLICKTIDFEESKIRKRFIVLPHVDKNLDEKKRMFNGLPDLMSEVARQEIDNLSSEIRECVVSYLPEIGYLLVIEMPEGKNPEDDHAIEGMNFMFHSNNQLFYKSAKTLELDHILGDTQLDIMGVTRPLVTYFIPADIELNIMHRLQATILECTSVMLGIMDLAAELDCLMALATCAGEFGYVQPSLVQDNVINIKGGRHPLQELCCNVFVANDVNLGGASSKMKLITGPNACGKSVYLKQVALIVFMAHIGSFVPAEEASLGPCDAIFSRLKSVESSAVQMSTFMQDLSQVSQALQSACSKSLVIMDEFGKGTESTDGLSLLTAVIKHWIRMESDCPFALMATHFHSIIHQRLLPNTRLMEYLTFDTLANEEEMVFLYQLIPGHTSSSYACRCAAQVGIPSQVVQRGQQVSDLLCQYKTVPLEDTATIQAKKQTHERIIDKFLDINLDKDDVNKFLKDYVLKVSGEINKIAKESKHGVGESHSVNRNANNCHPSTGQDKSIEIVSSKERNQRILDVGKVGRKNVKESRITFRKNDSIVNDVAIETRKEGGLTIKTSTFSAVGLTDTHYVGKQSQPCINRAGLKDVDSSQAQTPNDNQGENRMQNGGKDSQTVNQDKTSPPQRNLISQHMHTQRRLIRPISQRLPLYATPSSPKPYSTEYRNLPNFNSTLATTSNKRKMVIAGLTATQIKHEKLNLNRPTPCFSYLGGRSSFSANITASSTSLREDTNTSATDNCQAGTIRVETSTDPSYPCRSSDLSARPCVEETSAIETDEFQGRNKLKRKGMSNNRSDSSSDKSVMQTPTNQNVSAVGLKKIVTATTTTTTMETDDMEYERFPIKRCSSVSSVEPHTPLFINLKAKNPASTTSDSEKSDRLRKSLFSALEGDPKTSSGVKSGRGKERTYLQFNGNATPVVEGESHHLRNGFSSTEYKSNS